MERVRHNSFSFFNAPVTPTRHTQLSSPLKLSAHKLPQEPSFRELSLEASPLHNARVIQSKLVYIINLPESIISEELLRSYEYFGQYGSITKFVISKSSAHHSYSGKTSYGVYVTFAQEEEAAVCIKACNNHELQGHLLSATYGTTKYCSFFISGKACPKPNCLFLHQLASEKNTMMRDGLPANKHIQPENALLDKIGIEVLPNRGKTVLPQARIVRERICSQSNIVGQLGTARHRRFHSNLAPPPKSRYSFLEDSKEDPVILPTYFGEINHLAEPSKSSAELSSYHIEEIMSPSSPDKWAADVMEIKPRAFSEVITADTDLYIIEPRNN